MYIKWLNHPTDKTLNGQNFHVPRSVGEPAIYFQQAILAERPRYGSPEWAAERAEMAKLSAASPSKDDVCPETVEGTKWSLITRASNGRQLLVKRTGTEIYYFPDVESARKNGCPESVLKSFVPESRRQNERELAQEADLQRRNALAEQEKKDRIAAGAIMYHRQ
ncbi:MAG: hypothetical protein WBW46_00490 [Candidatus Sulfotelmatobacter sp.]